jgi:hypothetical protein
MGVYVQTLKKALLLLPKVLLVIQGQILIISFWDWGKRKKLLVYRDRVIFMMV